MTSCYNPKPAIIEATRILAEGPEWADRRKVQSIIDISVKLAVDIDSLLIVGERPWSLFCIRLGKQQSGQGEKGEEGCAWQKVLDDEQINSRVNDRLKQEWIAFSAYAEKMGIRPEEVE